MQPDRQTRLGEAAGNGGRRLLGEVEGEGKGRPVDPAVVQHGVGGFPVGIEGRDRQRRRDQQVPVAVKQVHVGAERAAFHLRVQDLERRDLGAHLRRFDQARVHQALALDRLEEKSGAREPVRAEDRLRVLEARVFLLDLGAEIFEHLD